MEGNWRITSNPLAWGNPEAEIVVLGFSKGPNAAGASLANEPHNNIAYKRMRTFVGKILAHVGLLEKGDNTALKNAVERAIADQHGRFHFGSFIRCGVERKDAKYGGASNGGMLDKFVATDFRLNQSLCLVWVQSRIMSEKPINYFNMPDQVIGVG